MAIQHVLAEVKGLSPVAKIGVALGLVLLLVILIGGAIGLTHHFEDAAATKREQKRVEERQQFESEKAQLQAEKNKALTDAADANARADTYKQVAESKRSDRAKTVKELEQIEADHAKHKAEAEAAGSSLSDDELRRELCARLAARGYKACD